MAYSATLIMEENTFTDNALSYTLASTNTDSNGDVIAPITENIPLSTGYSINHLGNAYFKKTGGNKTHTYTLKLYFLDTVPEKILKIQIYK